MKVLSLQEGQKSDAGTDDDRRMFQHENICQYGTDGSTKMKTHLSIPDE